MVTTKTGKKKEGKTMDELIEKFEQLTEENKVTALAYLEQLIAHQGTHQTAPDSQEKGA